MRNKCVRCGEDAGLYDIICYDCETREDRNGVIFGVAFIAIVLCVIFGARLLWANWVFNDWRCALSECRILKD